MDALNEIYERSLSVSKSWNWCLINTVTVELYNLGDWKSVMDIHSICPASHHTDGYGSL